MSEFKQYRRKAIAEMREYEPGETLVGVSISDADKNAGSPLPGDMIARNPKNHHDQWLVAAAYFADNFETITSDVDGQIAAAIENPNSKTSRALTLMTSAQRLRR